MVAAALPLVTLLCGCRAALLDPAGPVARSERLILLDAVVIMLAIIVPVILATLVFAWWFRAGNVRARRMPDWTYSGRLEILVWSIPTLVIMFLGGIAWTGSRDLDPARPLRSRTQALEIQVVALDWKWLFIYPREGIATLNLLRVPAGTPLRLRVTSASVLNVFFVPRLGTMLYCMNGMAGELNLLAERPVRTFGLSAMFSGDGFPAMQFPVEAVPAGQFEAWVGQLRGRGATLDERAYRQLLRQSVDDPPGTWGAVSPGLFDAVVLQRLPPGEGPVQHAHGARSVGGGLGS